MEDKAGEKIKEVIPMVSLEELKRIREEEFRAFEKYGSKVIERHKKSKIKADIKKIRAAKLRARFGITREGVEKTGKVMKGLGSGMKGAMSGILKIGRALGESAGEYQKRQDKMFKRR